MVLLNLTKALKVNKRIKEKEIPLEAITINWSIILKLTWRAASNQRREITASSDQLKLPFINHNSKQTLSFACWVKADSRWHLKYFVLVFPPKIIWHFMQIVSWGDYLHEMSNLILGKNIANLSPSELAQRVGKVNFIDSALQFVRYKINYSSSLMLKN